ncbi:MAG TPA: YncE family protein [Nitrospiraceae bacterium]|nr:YncE family protein [Nitrospiraceae bacterium]
MKKRLIVQSVIGAAALLAWSLMGSVPVSLATNGKTVKFIATDEPGSWFKCVSPFIDATEGGCVPKSIGLTQSLAIINPGDTVQIDMGRGINNSGVDTTNTVHTFTSLLWPLKENGKNADNMPFDEPEGAFRGVRSVKLTTPGLYVFVCKLHPFMLAATIVDANGLGDGLELGKQVRLINVNPANAITVPTNSDLASRLLRAFFLITNPVNYQDHRVGTWNVTLPGVPVNRTDENNVSDQVLLSALNIVDATLPELKNPTTPGIGEVWVDAQYEKTEDKTKPGTAIAVDTNTWKVTKRVSLPGINMNNPHNMWANRDQTVIYNTEWFGNNLIAFNRITGRMIKNIHVGHAPAHVMTRVDTDQVHVSLNGDDAIIELNPGKLEFSRRIFTQFEGDLPAQPHAHWMSFDGKTMVTPNSNTNDSTEIDIQKGKPVDKTPTGTLPIASSIMPDASKYYVSNYLDSTITCISLKAPACIHGHHKHMTKNIPLLANYNAISGEIKGPVGALPIQTPVSPDGKFVVTANTLTATITIIDTATDTLVAMLPCSAGCHGVNFGAKKGGGYYAYVSSKFSNDLVVVDLNGAASTIVGRILLVGDSNTKSDDSVDSNFNGLAGMGGQGVLPVPNVYNGWVQNLPRAWKHQLTAEQRQPVPPAE